MNTNAFEIRYKICRQAFNIHIYCYEKTKRTPAFQKEMHRNEKHQLGWLCLLVNHSFMHTLLLKGTCKCMKETGETHTTLILAFRTANKPLHIIGYFAFRAFSILL